MSFTVYMHVNNSLHAYIIESYVCIEITCTCSTHLLLYTHVHRRVFFSRAGRSPRYSRKWPAEGAGWTPLPWPRHVPWFWWSFIARTVAMTTRSPKNTPTNQPWGKVYNGGFKYIKFPRPVMNYFAKLECIIMNTRVCCVKFKNGHITNRPWFKGTQKRS